MKRKIYRLLVKILQFERENKYVHINFLGITLLHIFNLLINFPINYTLLAIDVVYFVLTTIFLITIDNLNKSSTLDKEIHMMSETLVNEKINVNK
jgi:hypothetical protein